MPVVVVVVILRLYLNKNLLQSAVPNWKRLGGLHLWGGRVEGSGGEKFLQRKVRSKLRKSLIGYSLKSS